MTGRMQTTRSAGTICLLLAALSGSACTPSPAAVVWHPGPQLMMARSSACAVMADHRLYVLGGGWTDALTALTTVEFSTVQANGQLSPWRLTARMSTPRVFLGCAVLNGYVYAIGGETFSGATPVLLPTAERARLLPDGHLGLWEPVASLTTPRRAPLAIATDRSLLVIGGYNGTFLRTVERARVAPDGTLMSWTVLTQQTIMARYVHAGARDSDALYLFGGHDEATGMATARTEWTRLLPGDELAPWTEGPVLNSPRFLSAATVIDGRLYLFGGSTGRQPLDTIEETALQPDGQPGAFRTVGRLSPPRSGSAAVASGATVYVIGGLINSQAVATVDYATIIPAE